MQDVNAAWSVLHDPRARNADLTLRRATAPAMTPASSPVARPMPRTGRPAVVLDDVDDDGAVLPFLVRVGPVVLLLGVLLVIFVVTAFAAGNRSVGPPRATTGITGVPEVGTCIDIRQVDIVAVGCESPVALRVEGVVEPGEQCAAEAVPVWWEEDALLCVRPQS
jgi:hypothetical protein